MKNFRVNARNIFLTYPKCELTKENLFDYFRAQYELRYLLVSREKHEDGTDHIHAILGFIKKADIKNERYFDIDPYHPNIQAIKNFNATKAYVKKDGDFKEWTSDQDTNEENFFEMAKTLDYENWFNFCINKKIPFAYANTIWNHISDTDTIHAYDCEDTLITESLRKYSWGDLYMEKPIIIQGETGIGKTCWAKLHAPKPALMVNHMDALKSFRPGFHKSIIFDDMSFTHMPREAQIMILDQHNSRQIHVRYGIVRIPKGTPKIFTCNVKIFEEDDPAIKRRFNKHLFN